MLKIVCFGLSLLPVRLATVISTALLAFSKGEPRELELYDPQEQDARSEIARWSPLVPGTSG
jgi:hypothetical protein